MKIEKQITNYYSLAMRPVDFDYFLRILCEEKLKKK